MKKEKNKKQREQMKGKIYNLMKTGKFWWGKIDVEKESKKVEGED